MISAGRGCGDNLNRDRRTQGDQHAEKDDYIFTGWYRCRAHLALCVWRPRHPPGTPRWIEPVASSRNFSTIVLEGPNPKKGSICMRKV